MTSSEHWIFVSLVAARTFQFVATAIACGGMLFIIVVLEPALNRSGRTIPAYPKLRRQLSLLIWVALAVLFLSALWWLVLQSADMSGAPVSEVASGGILWTVLTQTGFGNAWSVRLVLMLLLMLTWTRPTIPMSSWSGATRVALALSVAGALAWSGHAHAGSGLQRASHLAIDALHLIAAAAWLGALLPLAFVLRHSAMHAFSFKAVRYVVFRFSTLGIAAVAALVLSGIVNALMIIEEPRALFESTYGRILLLKVGLFLIMLAVAAFNRRRLTPQLANSNDAPHAVRALARNCLIEAALGGIILVSVGALGIVSPGNEG
jgi:putative copper resistance protein D